MFDIEALKRVCRLCLALSTDPLCIRRNKLRYFESIHAYSCSEFCTTPTHMYRCSIIASVQILFRPSHRTNLRTLAQKTAREMQVGNDFKTALSLARKGKTAKKDDTALNVPPKAAGVFEEEVIKLLQAKASRTLFDVNVRLLASASDPVRAKQILEDVAGSFTQFSAPEQNGLTISKVSAQALDRLIFNYSFRLFEESQVMHLSSEELASMYHFPLITTQAPRIKYANVRFAEPPPNLGDEGIQIGVNKFRGQTVPVHIKDNDRRRHFYLIGQTGTGKSSLMKNMIVQDIQRGKGVCLIDPHGEFAQYVLGMIPQDRADDVIYFDPGDTDYPLGLNMLEFDPRKPEQKTFITNELLTMIKSLYPDVPEAFGPMFEQYFKNAVLLLLDAWRSGDPAPTIAEIPRVLTQDSYRKELLSRESNPLVSNFWVLEAEKAGGEAALSNMAPYITSKLNPFLANDYLRPILAQSASAFNFRELIENRKILIANLSKGRIGDINAYLLGMIIVSKLLMAALSRVDIPDENQRGDYYLYMDEFQSFTTPSIAVILSEARKYRLNLIMAHQFIKQLRDDIKNAVFGNVGSLAAFRVGPDDAEFLKTQFDPVFTALDLMSVDNFNAHVRLLIDNQTARPFNIQTLREPESNSNLETAIKEVSRLTYGRPRDEIEDEIKERYSL